MLELLAEGQKPRQIAAEVGLSYSRMRQRLSRYVKRIGCKTREQAVAQMVTQKVSQQIMAMLPLAWRGEVERMMRRR